MTDNLFNQENRILLFDLTNFYFEGSKRSSQKVKFGRSKEKRSDCKLLVLALCINTDGFIRYSSIRKVQRKDENGDYYLQVNSLQKLHTEESMNGAFKERFELELTKAKQSLSRKGGTKTYEKVIERIGRACRKTPPLPNSTTLNTREAQPIPS